LSFPGTSPDIQEPSPIDFTLPFRYGFWQELGAKGTENEPFITGLSGYHLKGLFVLGHGALAQYFTGKYEIEVFPFEEVPGSPQHQDVTVDTGVHVPPISMPWVLNQLEMLLGNIHRPQGHIQLGSRPFGPLRIEKRGLKGDNQDLNPLVL
jgi:hypothetical protein